MKSLSEKPMQQTTFWKHCGKMMSNFSFCHNVFNFHVLESFHIYELYAFNVVCCIMVGYGKGLTAASFMIGIIFIIWVLIKYSYGNYFLIKQRSTKENTRDSINNSFLKTTFWNSQVCWKHVHPYSILSHTQSLSDASAADDFWKHCGSWRNCSICHNAFYVI